ncbi:hypothetical protein [Streptomyces hygroscopicus]|uniref:hypothetical protein n=1 Tax=Streptomyces hygroscopicus TaxID=1912 RepID=UPI003F1AA717
MKGAKIYVLVGSFNNSNNFWANHHNDSDWDPLLVVGEVTISTSDEEGAKTASITWGKPGFSKG